MRIEGVIENDQHSLCPPDQLVTQQGRTLSLATGHAVAVIA
jgi:hypothetical protein